MIIERRKGMKQVVLITGASRGIGYACAEKFASRGCGLVLNCHKNIEKLRDLKVKLEKNYNVECMISGGDVGDEAYVRELFEQIGRQFEGLDILINNAGIAHIGLLQDMTLGEWNEIINTNLTSQFLCCRSAIPLMLRKHRGSIINISSVWGSHGASCESAYSASKGGVNAFTKALARELAPSGIRVNAVEFGAIDTDMNHQLNEEERQELCMEIPVERMGTTGEAADLVVDIAINHPYLTAQIISMDGGWM